MKSFLIQLPFAQYDFVERLTITATRRWRRVPVPVRTSISGHFCDPFNLRIAIVDRAKEPSRSLFRGEVAHTWTAVAEQ